MSNVHSLSLNLKSMFLCTVHYQVKVGVKGYYRGEKRTNLCTHESCSQINSLVYCSCLFLSPSHPPHELMMFSIQVKVFWKRT